MLRFIVFAMLMAAARAAYESQYFSNSTRTSYRGLCPLIVGKLPFEPDRMAGEWQIAAGTPLFGDDLSGCPRFTLGVRRTATDLFYDVLFSAKSPKDGKDYTIEAFTQAYRPERGSFMLAVYRLQGTTTWSEVFGQSIVATDYETYAVFLACRPVYNADTGRFERVFGAQVWRRPGVTFNDATIKTLRNLLTSYDVDEIDIRNGRFDNC